MKRLILIGGAAGAGKTTVACTLADRMDAGWLQLDTIWIALRQAAALGSYEDRVLRIDERIQAGEEDADGLVEAHIEASGLVCNILPLVLQFELQAHQTLVADGAWLLPEFITNLRAQCETAQVLAVYLHESEPHEVQNAMESRREVALAAPWHSLAAQVSWAYGNYLLDEALKLGLSVVEARPRETLLERVKIALSLD